MPATRFGFISSWRRRPIDHVAFVVAGAQKCGTTALHHFIAKHPHIALPRDQALHFFDDDRHFNGEPDYKILHGSFKPSLRWQIAGEVTSDHIYRPTAMEGRARYNPKMKIIVSLEKLAHRAFS